LLLGCTSTGNLIVGKADLAFLLLPQLVLWCFLLRLHADIDEDTQSRQSALVVEAVYHLWAFASSTLECLLWTLSECSGASETWKRTLVYTFVPKNFTRSCRQCHNQPEKAWKWRDTASSAVSRSESSLGQFLLVEGYKSRVYL